MDIGQEFNSICEGYTGKISRWVPYYRELISSIAANLPEDFTARDIIDLGSGNGNVTALLLQRYPEASYTLVDASSEMVRECRERFREQTRFTYRQEFFQKLSFAPECFDLIAAGLCLHHLTSDEKQAFFKKIYRWLRPGGGLSYSDLFVSRQDEPYHNQVVAGWKRDAFQRGTTEEDWAWIMDHYRKYDHPDSLQDQTEWLKAAGFQEVQICWKLEAWQHVLVLK